MFAMASSSFLISASRSNSKTLGGIGDGACGVGVLGAATGDISFLFADLGLALLACNTRNRIPTIAENEHSTTRTVRDRAGNHSRPN